MKKVNLLSKVLLKWIVILSLFFGSLIGIVFWKEMYDAYLTNFKLGLVKVDFFNWLWNHGWMSGPTLIVVSCFTLIIISLYIVFEVIRLIFVFLKKYKIIKKGETNQAN